jgi:hypothetical protein
MRSIPFKPSGFMFVCQNSVFPTSLGLLFRTPQKPSMSLAPRAIIPRLTPPQILQENATNFKEER